MKRFLLLFVVLCFSAIAWGQDRPDAQMWFDSGKLYYGNKSADLNAEGFPKAVKNWTRGTVHIAISAQTAPEDITRLILNIPFVNVSYSLTLDEDRIAAGAATEKYYRTLPETEGIPAANADTEPRFVDGDMMVWLKNKVEALYPRECWENGIQGRVIVQFTIDERGRTGNVKVLKKAAPQLDRIAESIILSMPDWKPALDADGNPIKVSYNLPIVFQHQ